MSELTLESLAKRVSCAECSSTGGASTKREPTI